MSTPTFQITGGNPGKLMRKDAKTGQMRDVGSAVSGLIDFTVVNVASNAAKLALKVGAGAGHIAVGALVRITGEANRIEQLLTSTPGSDASWIVLRNTVNLTVHNLDTGDGSTADITLNGVSCPANDTTVVGWVNPDDLYNVGLQTYLVGASAPAQISYTALSAALAGLPARAAASIRIWVGVP